MPPPETRRGAPPAEKRLSLLITPAATPAKRDDRVSIVGQVSAARRPDAARDRAAWLATALHMRAAGLPVVVPELIGAWLRRQGIHPDWETAA